MKKMRRVLMILKVGLVKVKIFFESRAWRQISVESVKRWMKRWWSLSEEGSLSNKAVFWISWKNLRNQPSRTVMTVLAIAMGTAAVVFLVSFAYGLQEIVTKRLVSPNSMRMTDVVSSTTSLTLTDKTIGDIRQIDGVVDVAPVISLAGSLSFNDSRLDVVVVSVGEKYFEYALPVLIGGKWMSSESFAKYLGSIDDLSSLVGEVAGVNTDGSESVSFGDAVDELGDRRFVIKDDEYVPLRERADKKSKIIGYVKGNVLQSYLGEMIWGREYESVDASGRAYMTQDGDWYGKWMKTEVPVYRETMPTVYEVMLSESGQQVAMNGYLTMNYVKILSKAESFVQEGLENLAGEGQVLGDATASGVTQISLANGSSTAAAELVRVAVQETTNMATESAELSVVSIKRQGGKEVVVSSALLSLFKLKIEDIVGKEISLEYILSGGQIPGSTGRVLTNAEKYKVVGVLKEDKKAMIFAPVQDLQSVGVDKYSMLKVVSSDTATLAKVREKIQAMGFATQSMVDTLAQVDRLFRVMRFLLGAFGLTALIVALFGMFNTLTVSLLERSREVGVMKTLGTVDKDIFRLFMMESVLMGVIGGVVGIVVGVVGGNIINVLSMFWREDRGMNLFKTPMVFALGVLVLAVIVGLVTGLYPSMRAKKVSALDALRYE